MSVEKKRNEDECKQERTLLFNDDTNQIKLI